MPQPNSKPLYSEKCDQADAEQETFHPVHLIALLSFVNDRDGFTF
jgi:hypothetical protein